MNKSSKDSINQVNDLDPQRTRSFINHIKDMQNKRIYLHTLMELFTASFPQRPRETELRTWLLLALQQASAEGAVQLPASLPRGKCWDTTFDPALPTFVTRIADAKAEPKRPWQYFPWRPELAWVGTLPQLSQENEDFLRKVQRGLVNNEFAQLAPLKRRSLELTGDEKRLGALLRTTLFGEQRLSLSMLGCVPNHPQLAIEKVNDNPKVIVFENIEPFRVAYKVLRNMQHPPYGIVAFGAGMGFSRSITTLTEHSIESIEYIGDIDQPGLRIVRSATRRAQELGLPPLVPAAGIHRAMIDISHRFGKPLGFVYKKAKNMKIDQSLLVWLPQNTQSDVLNVLNAGNRIAEEILAEGDLKALWENLP